MRGAFFVFSSGLFFYKNPLDTVSVLLIGLSQSRNGVLSFAVDDCVFNDVLEER